MPDDSDKNTYSYYYSRIFFTFMLPVSNCQVYLPFPSFVLHSFHLKFVYYIYFKYMSFIAFKMENKLNILFQG